MTNSNVWKISHLKLRFNFFDSGHGERENKLQIAELKKC